MTFIFSSNILYTWLPDSLFLNSMQKSILHNPDLSKTLEVLHYLQNEVMVLFIFLSLLLFPFLIFWHEAIYYRTHKKHFRLSSLYSYYFYYITILFLLCLIILVLLDKTIFHIFFTFTYSSILYDPKLLCVLCSTFSLHSF
jgi:hypothetical protein